MGWELLVGPAIVAAIVSATVTVAGWYVQWWSNRNLEAERRREKVTDIQTALLAEIRSKAHHLAQYELMDVPSSVSSKLTKRGTLYNPFVPREAGSPVFTAVTKEISILPTEVIDPVILFYTQMEAVSHFADDLRSDRFLALEKDQKLTMLSDYLQLKVHAGKLATTAVNSIETSLAVSRSGADRLDQKSAWDA